MKTQKYLPGTQLSGKIIDTKIEEFTTQNGPAVNFVILVKDVWKDKDGNKVESDPYYADCVAFGQKNVEAVKNISMLKQMAVARVLPRLEKWTDKTLNIEKSKVKYRVSFIEGWYFESGSWICSQDETVGDLPF
jgi:single-stranded DNA-binding protein